MDAPLNSLPRRPHGPGDEWVYGENGEKFWGSFGAAGLLVWHRTLGVLLQHRSLWSHFGGTWGLPGGALKPGESAVAGAMREANEEAGVDPELLRVMFSTVLDRGVWTYTTVVVEAETDFEPVIGDAESVALAWVALDDVARLPLHPGFEASWVDLRPRLV
ncbi:8-oxo-dGTP pyrophosphatase MutT (NUDIX family) [Salinibacterium sp. CAN_S4]|uniref:NUDIX domain-containing protein n=1 Tax=Salinibacterium sp. CAN_S4 TaxID=2787727 RepID=UPI0018EF7900